MKSGHACIIAMLFFFAQVLQANTVQIKDLTRLNGVKDNALVGYGIVTGLAGTGDSRRSRATFQSIKNILLRFGVSVPITDVNSRNAAAVMVTTTLPAYAQVGDKIDINVTSIGDARNLVGGTLLMTHLIGADQQTYALAQGPISVGGFSYDFNGNLVQKNHPTAGNVPDGAIIEKSVVTQVVDDRGSIQLNLHSPSYTTAFRIAESIDRHFQSNIASAASAASVKVSLPAQRSERGGDEEWVEFIQRIQEIYVVPDIPLRVVVNERTGTVVSGGDIKISPITITHGDLTVNIKSEFFVSQPFLVRETGPDVRTETIQQTEIEVDEEDSFNIDLAKDVNVADLVSALNKVKASSRDVIVILQSIKRAGALHAELIIQ